MKIYLAVSIALSFFLSSFANANEWVKIQSPRDARPFSGQYVAFSSESFFYNHIEPLTIQRGDSTLKIARISIECTEWDTCDGQREKGYAMDVFVPHGKAASSFLALVQSDLIQAKLALRHLTPSELDEVHSLPPLQKTGKKGNASNQNVLKSCS